MTRKMKRILGLVSVGLLLIFIGCSKPVEPVKEKEEEWQIELPEGAQEISLEGAELEVVMSLGWTGRDRLKPEGSLGAWFCWRWGECPIPADWQTLLKKYPSHSLHPLVKTKVIHRYQGEADVVLANISIMKFLNGEINWDLSRQKIGGGWYPPDSLVSSPESQGNREWFEKWEGVGEYIPPQFKDSAPEPGEHGFSFVITDPYWTDIKNYKIIVFPEKENQ